MSTPAYAVSIAEAVKNLTFALAEAEAELTNNLKVSHWLEGKKGPNAWQETYHKFGCTPLATPELITALFALWKAMDAREMLKGVLDEVEMLSKPVRVPDLKIGKQRPEGLAK